MTKFSIKESRGGLTMDRRLIELFVDFRVGAIFKQCKDTPCASQRRVPRLRHFSFSIILSLRTFNTNVEPDVAVVTKSYIFVNLEHRFVTNVQGKSEMFAFTYFTKKMCRI